MLSWVTDLTARGVFSATRPLQPNHRPPCRLSAGRIATSSPRGLALDQPQHPFLRLRRAAPIPVSPASRQLDCRQDQSRHRISLRKIPPQFSGHGVYVLRQKAVPISHSKRVDEHVVRLVPPPNFPQCIDQPEAANQKSRLRQAKIIGSDIPHNVKPAPKFKSDGFNSCYKPRIVRRYQAKLRQQKGAGIEIFAVKCGRKRLALGAPRSLEQLLSDVLGNAGPMVGTFRKVQVVRDGCEALTARPAHRGRMRVHARASTIFPDAGIGLECELRRLLAEWLERVKKRRIARSRQPAVKEYWRRGHDDAAVDIVLTMIRGRLSDGQPPS